MDNVTLLFKGTAKSNTQDTSLLLFANSNNEIFIEIDEATMHGMYICLSRATAIRLHKELKRQISYLDSEEVNNG